MQKAAKYQKSLSEQEKYIIFLLTVNIQSKEQLESKV